MSKLLALDQSSRVTGWSIFEDGKLQQYGKFNAENAGTQIGKRLEYITEVILEDIQMQGNVVNNVQTFKVLAEVFGVISELLVELHIPQSAVPASTWKSKLSIHGRARAEQKRNAQEWVFMKYSVKPTQDECDAICIGAYRCSNTPDEGYDWAE